VASSDAPPGAPRRPGCELKVLIRHRRDLSDDRTRTVNRLRGHLTEKIAETGRLIEGRFRGHRNAEVITSMPGIGIPPVAPSSSPPPAETWPPSPARTGWQPTPAFPGAP
jgi:hypothetical protein